MNGVECVMRMEAASSMRTPRARNASFPSGSQYHPPCLRLRNAVDHDLPKSLGMTRLVANSMRRGFPLPSS